jgi:8-oxo-dGTP pyrophosphatase MutT (NUDIX family)
VKIRDAATVVLLRDGTDGLQVWLQKRSAGLEFGPNVYAFPGGAVDPDDWECELPPYDLARHAQRWAVDIALAHALLSAALRETEEESGVVLPPVSLAPWSRWITPPGLPRRFDARFFVAPVPVGQEPRALTSEVASADWFGVRAAIDAAVAGELTMWPPTTATLKEVAAYDTADAVMAAAPKIPPTVSG